MNRIVNANKIIKIPSFNNRVISIPYDKLEYHIIKYLRYQNHEGYNSYLDRLMSEDDYLYNRFIMYLENEGYIL